jgi:acyl-CoA synthetase (AMP-forming)/AMP-acid ligase II
VDPFFIQSLGKITDVQTGETWGSDRLRSEIFKRNNYYSEQGVEKKDNIAILHNNNNSFFADLFSMWMLGACVSCLDKDIGADEFVNLCEELDIKYVIINKSIPKKLINLTSIIRVLDTNNSDDYEEKLIYTKKSIDDPALILFTSGSTGMPKGVVHSLRTLQIKWEILQNYVSLDICKNTLCPLPTHFGHGLICNSLYPLVHGKHIVLLPKSDIKNLINLSEIIDKYEISFISSVAAMWRIVLRICPPPKKNTLKQVNIGSAPLGVDLWKLVQKWSGTKQVWNVYGITETGSWVAGPVAGDDSELVDGLIGRGWGAEIMITNTTNMSSLSNAENISLPLGEKGHIWIRTPCIMHRYWNNEKETKQVVQGSWFYTGDIGMLDDCGRLILTGRERNEINKGGAKVSPEELDLVIEKHPAINEACAFAYNDKILGEDIGVCVVFNESVTHPKLTEIEDWVKNKLSDYKVPARWYSVENIVKTSRGKVNRQKVSEYCQDIEFMKY